MDASVAKRILYKHPGSKFISWPDDWKERHYNGSHDPCDMLIGFCSCGAAHYEGEQWVQRVLDYYKAEIRDYPNNPSRADMIATLGEEEVAFRDEQARAQRESLTLSYF